MQARYATRRRPSATARSPTSTANSPPAIATSQLRRGRTARARSGLSVHLLQVRSLRVTSPHSPDSYSGYRVRVCRHPEPHSLALRGVAGAVMAWSTRTVSVSLVHQLLFVGAGPPLPSNQTFQMPTSKHQRLVPCFGERHPPSGPPTPAIHISQFRLQGASCHCATGSGHSVLCVYGSTTGIAWHMARTGSTWHQEGGKIVRHSQPTSRRPTVPGPGSAHLILV